MKVDIKGSVVNPAFALSKEITQQSIQVSGNVLVEGVGGGKQYYFSIDIFHTQVASLTNLQKLFVRNLFASVLIIQGPFFDCEVAFNLRDIGSYADCLLAVFGDDNFVVHADIVYIFA